MKTKSRIYLNGEDWQFKGFIGEDWVWRNSFKEGSQDKRFWEQGTVPGSVHNDLWNAGEIPDPYFERNSLLLEWIPERTWVYRKEFLADKKLKGKDVFLHFAGVDYECTVFLNGQKLGSHKGMFTPIDFEVSELLKFNKQNLLAVVIERAPDEEPQVSKTEYVHTHKTRMNYWWDFCPRMIHLGIWDDVYLEYCESVRIKDIFVRPQLEDDFKKAYLDIRTELDVKQQDLYQLEFFVKYEDKVIVKKREEYALTAGNRVLNSCLELENPRLWWPNNYGEQPLYRAEVVIKRKEKFKKKKADAGSVNFGIRRVEFVKNEKSGENSRPYTPVVNGQRIYIKGWNWVPLDVMYGVERPEKLKRLLRLAREAGVNMLRVWGGGLIEKDYFYELCSRHGIMIWQEFIQSSSGIANKPSEKSSFIEMIVKEAETIIPRKRNCPSLVIWCGGNELQNYENKPLGSDEPVLAALKKVVGKLDPDRHWLPTSPTGPVFENTLENIEKNPTGLHDVHGPWEYQGPVQHYSLYNKTTSLLHSEFGVEGMTGRRTLDMTIAEENQWPATKENPVYFHLGAWWNNESLLQEIFKGIDNINDLINASQFLQAEGLRYAVEANRRRKYQNSGTLPWQFNEPYPNASCTSAIDYYTRPKPVYYVLKKAYQELTITASFERQIWAGQDNFCAKIYSSNSSMTQYNDARVNVRIIGASGESYKELQVQKNLQDNKASFLGDIEIAIAEIKEQIFFLDLELIIPNGKKARNRYLFTNKETLAPMLKCPCTSLELSIEKQADKWNIKIKNSGKYAALLLSLKDILDLETNVYPYYSDNYFTLLAGEEKTLSVDWDGTSVSDRKLLLTGWNTKEVIIV